MRTRGGDATGSVPAAAAATARTLRPRQAPGARGALPGVTRPRDGGRVTRSSALIGRANPVQDNNNTVPQPSPPGPSRRSHKRSRSEGVAASSRQPKRACRRRQSPGFYGEDSDSGDEHDNPYMTPGSEVRELWVDVEEIASKTYRGQPLDIEALVRNLPQLKSIRFFHQKDEAPYRSLDGSLRWHYPAALFEVLNGTPVPAGNAGPVEHARLSEWQWNRRLMGPKLDLAGIKLASRDLAFVQSMADAITAVPTLQHLAIESSTVVNDRLLPLLPKSLQTLELVNCWDVNSEDFASYLLSSGSQLRHLILRHNQSLSLSFVTVLATACPRLELLYVDFKTYKHHEFYKDSDPSYDELLTAEQVPEWPQSLEALHLLNMKKWEAEAAETLIQSLIDSAPKLLKLRQLELKAMLSIPIHERSQLRNKWGTKLKRVFLREKKDPKPFFSLSSPAQQAATEVRGTREKKSRKTVRATAVESPSRRSARLAAQFSNPSSRASSVGRDLRSGLGRPFYAEPDTDVDEEDEEQEQELGQVTIREGEDNSSGENSSSVSPAGAPAATKTVPFRHGMCEKVVLQLDNQKLVETALTMDDFLDSEGDDLSDDDWAGEDEDFDSGYAW
ncbi:uncharacterized protein THITE_2156762 [Thermothielavioides terrestris NRRL 8126]|uniref:Uncharacterized protein n=1 Tax=Thermothielavioides terrestris (strain ATCC 38088 / NRRL 8126) TaxID=578455 RepID=G2RIA2_THETT|nr:uncharacterized protein THITE_2156762 [Thermothielavioides terrestris NRRL 8126]AEO71564.1 hypothetical protein THITE_2156762 [Thermothielavioides terrestris NRRL 8126]